MIAVLAPRAASDSHDTVAEEDTKQWGKGWGTEQRVFPPILRLMAK